jgi:hypothetical protein
MSFCGNRGRAWRSVDFMGSSYPDKTRTAAARHRVGRELGNDAGASLMAFQPNQNTMDFGNDTQILTKLCAREE